MVKMKMWETEMHRDGSGIADERRVKRKRRESGIRFMSVLDWESLETPSFGLSESRPLKRMPSALSLSLSILVRLYYDIIDQSTIQNNKNQIK